jgi:hypothetical protein
VGLFLDDRGGELHSESSQFIDSLEELMQDLSICFSSICWVYCIIQSASPLTLLIPFNSCNLEPQIPGISGHGQVF